MTTFGWFCLRGLTCTSGCIWGCSWWSRGFLATDRNRPKNDPLFESDSSKSWQVNQIIECTILWLTGQLINKNYVNSSLKKYHHFLDIWIKIFSNRLLALSITVSLSFKVNFLKKLESAIKTDNIALIWENNLAQIPEDLGLQNSIEWYTAFCGVTRNNFIVYSETAQQLKFFSDYDFWVRLIVTGSQADD